MKITRDRINKRYNREVTIKMRCSEYLLVINSQNYYKLGEHVDDIVQGSVIKEMCEVQRCSVAQKWVPLDVK